MRSLAASGAAVWSSPTVDVTSATRFHAAAGNSYSNPPANTSDAVLVALDLKTGAMLLHQQLTVNDAYIVRAVWTGTMINCPDNHGPDYDFGQSPILARLSSGPSILAIAQKSGFVHALDPEPSGQNSLANPRRGGRLGGSQWGSAVDRDRIYVAVSDVRFLQARPFRLNPDAGGGLFSLDLATGKAMWAVPPVPYDERSQCSPALSAAVTVIPGVIFSGGVSGILRAYATADGSPLWEADTERDYATVNGVTAHGGAMDGPGPVHCRRHVMRHLGLRPVGRTPRKRGAGLLGQR